MLVTGDSILAFNYGILTGIFASALGLMFVLSRVEQGDYNKSATQRVLEQHCQTIWKYVLTGDVSLGQLIHDVANNKLGAPMMSQPGDSTTSKPQASEDPTTINSLSFNSSFTKKTIKGPTLPTFVRTVETVQPQLQDISVTQDSRPSDTEKGDRELLNSAVMELERRGEAWENLTVGQNRIEELALRVLQERPIPDTRVTNITTDESAATLEIGQSTGIQLLEILFKTRQQESIMRQKEIRKFEAFLSDFARVYSKFSAEVARLSKEASNIGNALIVDGINATMQAQSNGQDGRSNTETKRRYSLFGNKSPKKTSHKNDQNNERCKPNVRVMDGSWTALSIFLSHCSRDNDVISSIIQKMIIPKMPLMAEEVSMFEKRLVTEGNELFSCVRESERLYDVKRKERARIHDKVQSSFEQQIATDSKRRLTLAMGKMGASPAVAKAAGLEAAASSRCIEADTFAPADGSPSLTRERRTSVINTMPADAVPVATIGMTTTANVLTMKELKANEKLTEQLQNCEEECEELSQNLIRAKEKLSVYLPRVFEDFDRIAIKSELELRTHLVLVSQKLEVAHEKGLPASNRLQAQMGTTRVGDAFGEVSGDPDGLDANKDLLRVLRGMLRERNNKNRHRASSDVSIKSNGSYRDGNGSPSVVTSPHLRPLSPLIPLKFDSSYTPNGNLDTSGNASPDSRVRLDSSGSVPLDAVDGTPEPDDYEFAQASLDMYAEATACLAATPLSRLPKLPGSFNDVVGNESAVWFNAVIGRIYRDLSISPYFHNYFCSRATSALNRGNRPKYIDSFVVSDVTFGSMPPSLCNFCWKPVDTSADTGISGAVPSAGAQRRKSKSGASSHMKSKKTMESIDEENPDNTVVVSADIAFRSGLAFTINTKIRLFSNRMVINIKLHVEVLELSGSCQFGMRHSGSFFSFLEEPHLYVNIRSEVGNSAHFKLLDVPQLSSVIRQKLRSFITKKLVSPNQFVFRLPHPRAWWPKGTEFFFSGHSDKDAAVDPVTGLREVKLKQGPDSIDESKTEMIDTRHSETDDKTVDAQQRTSFEMLNNESSKGRRRSHTTGHIQSMDLPTDDNLKHLKSSGMEVVPEKRNNTESSFAEVKSDLVAAAIINITESSLAEVKSELDNDWDEYDDEDAGDSGSDSSDDARESSTKRKSLLGTVRKRRNTSVTVTEYLSKDSKVPKASNLPNIEIIDIKSINPAEAPGRERRRSMFDILLGNKKAAPARSPIITVSSPEIIISEEILAAARAHMEAADAATYEYESSEDENSEIDEELFKDYIHETEHGDVEDVFGNINLSALRRKTIHE